MNDIKLGTAPASDAKRDAIHIAMAPAVAGEPLTPGEHVGLNADGTASAFAKHIGIVDPFLESPLRKGDRFWLLLYQNTVTGMRHEWSHPSFGNDGMGDVAASRCWLESYARVMGTTYQHLIDNLEETGSVLVYEDRTDDPVSPELSRHYELATGNKLKEDIYFRCAC